MGKPSEDTVMGTERRGRPARLKPLRVAHAQRLRNSARLILRLTRPRPYVTRCNATMNNRQRQRPKNLGNVEQVVMDYLWEHSPCTAEACREALVATQPMKDSTMRTVLRRLEEKGYVAHETQGRTYIYRAIEPRENVAVRAVKNIIDRFCGGSAEELLLGMVDNEVVDRKQLERIARKIAQRKEGKR
jgi:BlaI family transcriptional regulator, penicillinase repressor